MAGRPPKIDVVRNAFDSVRNSSNDLVADITPFLAGSYQRGKLGPSMAFGSHHNPVGSDAELFGNFGITGVTDTDRRLNELPCFLAELLRRAFAGFVLSATGV